MRNKQEIEAKISELRKERDEIINNAMAPSSFPNQRRIATLEARINALEWALGLI